MSKTPNNEEGFDDDGVNLHHLDPSIQQPEFALLIEQNLNDLHIHDSQDQQLDNQLSNNGEGTAGNEQHASGHRRGFIRRSRSENEPLPTDAKKAKLDVEKYKDEEEIEINGKAKSKTGDEEDEVDGEEVESKEMEEEAIDEGHKDFEDEREEQNKKEVKAKAVDKIGNKAKNAQVENEDEDESDDEEIGDESDDEESEDESDDEGIVEESDDEESEDESGEEEIGEASDNEEIGDEFDDEDSEDSSDDEGIENESEFEETDDAASDMELEEEQIEIEDVDDEEEEEIVEEEPTLAAVYARMESIREANWRRLERSRAFLIAEEQQMVARLMAHVRVRRNMDQQEEWVAEEYIIAAYNRTDDNFWRPKPSSPPCPIELIHEVFQYFKNRGQKKLQQLADTTGDDTEPFFPFSVILEEMFMENVANQHVDDDEPMEVDVEGGPEHGGVDELDNVGQKPQ